MKRRYPGAKVPRDRLPERQKPLSRKEREARLTSLPAYFRSWLELVRRYAGIEPGAGGLEGYMRKFRQWATANVEQHDELGAEMRAQLLENGRENGWKRVEDYPIGQRGMLEELSLTMAAKLFMQVLGRVGPDLERRSVAEQVAALEQAVTDIEKVVEYLLDVTQPQRGEWLAIVETNRAEYWRVAQVLRKRIDAG
ncbi:MAG: hypothetical protein ABL962_07765 [Fimbriimonadaceae bacterium]